MSGRGDKTTMHIAHVQSPRSWTYQGSYSLSHHLPANPHPINSSSYSIGTFMCNGSITVLLFLVNHAILNVIIFSL